MLASGIFDHPLVVLAVLIAGAIIQWLTQKRQAEEARRQAETDEEGASQPPAKETALERKLRELLGETTPSSSPPPVLRRDRGEPAPDSRWEEWESGAQSQAPPPVYSEPAVSVERRPAPPQISLPASAPRLIPSAFKEVARGLEVLRASPSRLPGPRTRGERGSSAQAWLWRDRKSARRAFIASVVFGPPKGLEP